MLTRVVILLLLASQHVAIAFSGNGRQKISVARETLRLNKPILSSHHHVTEFSKTYHNQHWQIQRQWRTYSTVLGYDTDIDDDDSSTSPPNNSTTTATAIISPKTQKRGLSPLDNLIFKTAIPSMINLAIVPIVNAVDTFWVGRTGSALALAGQAAANQAFFTIFFMISFLPTVTAPLVADAMGSNDLPRARDRISEALFLCYVMGFIGTTALVVAPRTCLRLILSPGAPAVEFAAPYLRWRCVSMIPALLSSTGFAAYRGMLDTVTPLKVSAFTNLLNLVLDPLLIFKSRLGFIGAAIATAISEWGGGLVYLRLLLRKKLTSWKKMLMEPPAWENLAPLLRGGLAMLARQMVLNVAFISTARRAQALDPSGVTAAAYGIVMQIYSVGIITHVAMQASTAALISSSRAAAAAAATNTSSKPPMATPRATADRLFFWGTLLGIVLAATQLLLTPTLVPLFSTLEEVRTAVRQPALISALIHIVNGPVFIGEGCLMGLGQYGALAGITAVGVASLVGALTLGGMGTTLEGILWSMAIFNTVQGFGVVWHYLGVGELRRWGRRRQRGLPQLDARPIPK